MQQFMQFRIIFFWNSRLRLPKEAAKKARDSLARAIYKCIFQHIIDTFNGDALFSSSYIGILDIAGFGE